MAAATLGAGGVVAHAPGQITATTLYVSTTGLDTNPCSQTQPCQTLQHAVDTANSGDTVRVLPGAYNQAVNITKPLTLVGSGETSTIIDGSNIDAVGATASIQRARWWLREAIEHADNISPRDHQGHP